MLVICDITNTIVSLIIEYFFISVFLDPKPLKHSKKAFIVLLWMASVIIFTFILNDWFIIKMITVVTISSIFYILMFNGHKLVCAGLTILHYCLILVVEMLVYMLAIRIVGDEDILDANMSATGVFGGAVTLLTLFVINILLSTVFKKDRYKPMNPLELVKYLALPVISVGLILYWAYAYRGVELSIEEYQSFTLFFLVLVVINIYMFWVMKVDFEQKIAIEKSRITNDYAHELSALYHQITDEHRQIAGIEHEYKNILTTINTLALSGQYEKLQQYLLEQKLSPVYDDIVDTGNVIATAVINAKYAEAVRKGISVRINLDSLADLKIKDSDLVIILSNLFNNAIEACEKVSDNKVIDIEIKNNGGMLVIKFVNTVSNNHSAYNKDYFRHGHGINNITGIVKDLGGECAIDRREESFHVTIVIPL